MKSAHARALRCISRGTLYLATCTLYLGIGLAQAQTYPARPIRMVIPFPAGGSIDIVARSISQRWVAQLGQQIVIDNRAGAAGAIGT